jgi:hypothetical protein
LQNEQYLVLKYCPNSSSPTLGISHYSPSSIDLLCLNLPNGAVAHIFNKDVFSILAPHSSSSSNHRALKMIVKDSIKRGSAVSVEMGLLTGFEEKRGFSGANKRKEERYVGHWTPLKDEEGNVKWVVLTIAPK